MEFAGFSSEQWVQVGISFGILLGALVLTRPVLNFVLDRMVKRVAGISRSRLDDMIIEAVRPPLYWMVVAYALRLSVDRLAFLSNLVDFSFESLYFVLYTVIVVVTFWRLTDAVSGWYQQEAETGPDVKSRNRMAPFIRRVLYILLVMVASIMVLRHFDIEVSGLVTTLGIGSLAVALAGQAALADTINGFLIMIDQPFRIGDRIEIQDLDTWGDVIDIGLRSTRIRTRDNRMVIVPNSVIGKSLVVNHSYPDTEYRIQVHVGIAYGTDLELARSTMVEAVKTVPGVLAERPVEALFLTFGDSALVFRVRWWIESYVDTRIMFDRVNTAIYNALEAAGVEIPFPQSDIHHKIDLEDVSRFGEMLDKTKK